MRNLGLPSGINRLSCPRGPFDKHSLWIWAWVGFFMASSGIYAQDTGAFRGKVTDPSGAAVPGPEIRVTDEKLGVTKSTVANEEGDYELGGLTPGTYTIEVELSGFEKYQ